VSQAEVLQSQPTLAPATLARPAWGLRLGRSGRRFRAV